jgi:hypothetical protein
MRRMRRNGLWCLPLAALVALAFYANDATAVSLDKEGTITLGLRTYANTRIGTEATDETITPTQYNATFPFSAGGHARQMRYYVEAEMNHVLAGLVEKSIGPFSLVKMLPFKVRNLAYHVTYRGEGDMIYDWGPKEYSTATQFKTLPGNPVSGLPVNVNQAREELRHIAAVRNRLFQAYVQADVGSLFIRFGRQLLSWGETDVFRLLDNINPLDNSFGGFLVSLDERRVPLDMLRMQYTLGDLGPVTESFIEGYGAIDNKVGWAPGTPSGSPWTFPNLGTPQAPSNTTQVLRDGPTRTFDDARGGARFVWNMYDATFSVAQYWTYVDTPGLQIFIKPNFPFDSFPDGFTVKAHESPPKVSVTGGSTTFALPSLYSVVRSEIAYMYNEPRYTQVNIDPFSLRAQQPRLLPTTGGRDTGDSLNMVLGLDINRYIRFLNPNQTFLISTQFFVKHLFGVASDTPIRRSNLTNGEVLPVPARYILDPGGVAPVRPVFVRQPTDTLLNTLLITTSFRSSTIEPQFVFLYDWGGAFLYQPTITFRHDPFRFVIDASFISAHTLKGGSGISLFRDRDNVQFRLEYVI